MNQAQLLELTTQLGRLDAHNAWLQKSVRALREAYEGTERTPEQQAAWDLADTGAPEFPVTPNDNEDMLARVRESIEREAP